MNTQALNSDLIALVEKKIELSQLSYADAQYDEVEEEMHTLEDRFVDNYGDYLEQALEKVHSEYAIESEVLLPIAYLANHYERTGKSGDSAPEYEVSHEQGVWVETDKFPGKQVRLALVPNPTRIILSAGPKYQEAVWKAG